MRLFYTIAICLCMVPFAQTASACPGLPIGYKSASNMEENLQTQHVNAPIVFTGKVVKTKNRWFVLGSDLNGGKLDLKTKFKVIRMIRGEYREYVTIYHSKSDSCYGVTFNSDDEFLIAPRKSGRKLLANNRNVGTYGEKWYHPE